MHRAYAARSEHASDLEALYIYAQKEENVPYMLAMQQAIMAIIIPRIPEI